MRNILRGQSLSWYEGLLLCSPLFWLRIAPIEIHVQSVSQVGMSKLQFDGAVKN